MKEKVNKTDKEWKAQLTDQQFHVARKAGTERAFTGQYWDHHEKGVYTCVCCGEALFSSESKYNSGSGWPSFYAPVADVAIAVITDQSHGMVRKEALCANCDAHLGHIFADGPQPTGQRYCMNSASLNFIVAQDKVEAPISGENAFATFGAGCFWCIEAVFQEMNGVVAVEAGYSGGKVKNPTYKEICSGLTGHAEVARLTYDPAVVSYEDLLEVFWMTHDPTTLNRQGNDVGTQYRSVIFFHDNSQKEKAELYRQKLIDQKVFEGEIVTEVAALTNYFVAEDYHQNYFNLNKGQGYCQVVIRPKVEKFRKVFPEKLKNKA